MMITEAFRHVFPSDRFADGKQDILYIGEGYPESKKQKQEM